MRERLIEFESDRRLLVRRIGEQKLPFTVKITEGRMHSYDQNQLQWMWATEAAEQREGTTPQEVQAEWKLNFGVPILRSEDEEFAKQWARVERRLVYNEQLALMHLVPVTSIMTLTQFANYLDQVYRSNAENDIKLTDPEELRWKHAEDGQGVAR